MLVTDRLCRKAISCLSWNRDTAHTVSLSGYSILTYWLLSDVIASSTTLVLVSAANVQDLGLEGKQSLNVRAERADETMEG